jgi:5-formyltetrahydrofolate cyclo-ligase
MDKNQIRKKISKIRDSQKEEEILRKSKIIGEKLFSLLEFKNSSYVMFYSSIRSEVRTDFMIERAIKDGYKVFLPKTNIEIKELIPLRVKNLKELERGAYNILEPKLSAEKIDVDMLEIIIVPGVAFDENCYRIGYGGGFYDRFLKKVKNAKKIGLAYELQIIPEIPKEKNDVKLDIIITEKRIITGK